MKSYNHLFEKLITDENFDKAFDAVMKSHTKQSYVKKVQYYISHKDKVKDRIKESLNNYHSSNHSPVYIKDGYSKKERTIIVPRFDEQIVHHMVIQILEPIIMKGMYKHSYGSIPGRGPIKAKNALARFIKTGGKNIKYCAKLDIRKFFDSIPRSDLIKMIRNTIHDKRFVTVMEGIICIDTNSNGVPLGFYTSQWLANWYLQKLDHFIKEDLQIKYYVRYMDDMAIFGANKRELHMKLRLIFEYIERLGLQVKDNWQLFLFHYVDRNGVERGADLNFIGFRFYRNRTTLRKCLFMRICRKSTRMSKGRVSIFTCRQYISYYGYIKNSNTYLVYIEKLMPRHSFRKTRTYISKWTKAHKS